MMIQSTSKSKTYTLILQQKFLALNISLKKELLKLKKVNHRPRKSFGKLLILMIHALEGSGISIKEKGFG